MITSKWTRHQLRRTLVVVALTVAVAPLIGGCPLYNQPQGNDNSSGGGNENSNSAPAKGNSGLTGAFVGAERCATCHNNIHTDWSNTLHSRALETLEAIGQDKNSECLGCHTVGFGQPGGFVDRATTDALAGVGCESCHEGAAAHAQNANDETLRPKADISASICAKCHTGTYHPNHEDWAGSKHADSIEDSQITNWSAGGSSSNLTNCGKCHSGDYFFHKIVKGETVDSKGVPVDGNYLQGKTSEQMNRITCAVCHNPHARTGNAATPDDGRDYQLRFPQIAYTTPTSDLTAAQDGSRFNLCGQCHHTRDRTWIDGSREPHPSDQANVFFGELPSPNSQPDPIVPFRASVHLNAAEQCSTCHVYRAAPTDVSPAVSGHTFEVNFDSCAECHGTREIGEAKLAALKAELDLRNAQILKVLEEWALANDIDGKGKLSWEYTSEGGPNSAGQAKIPDNIKKARYIYYYVLAGGGNGAHNPDFVRDALEHALDYAETAPPRLP